MQVPAEALQMQQVPETEAPQGSSSEQDPNSSSGVRVKFVLYSSDKLFPGNRTLLMPVISASVGNVAVKNLTEPVTYFMDTPRQVDSRSFKPVCVYWDENGGG